MIPTDTLWTSKDFAKNNHGIKESTAKRRWKSIPGGQEVCGEVFFRPGSRYPFNTWLYVLDTYENRMYVLLKAISKYRYISHTELYLTETQFNAMLKWYVDNKYIEENGSKNPYGANAYDITMLGSTRLAEIDTAKQEKRAGKIDRAFKIARDIEDLLLPFSGIPSPSHSDNDGDSP